MFQRREEFSLYTMKALERALEEGEGLFIGGLGGGWGLIHSHLYAPREDRKEDSLNSCILGASLPYSSMEGVPLYG